MALPITVQSGNNVGNAAFQTGGRLLFKEGTSFYVLGSTFEQQGNHQPRIWKADSDDPSSGWSIQDNGALNNSQWYANNRDGFLEGGNIQCYHQRCQNHASDVFHSEFDCSTNTWITSPNQWTQIYNPGNPEPFAPQMGAKIRSDGDHIIAFAGDEETVMGIGYSRIWLGREETGSWTIEILAGGRGKTAVHERHADIVAGDTTNDRMHIFWHEDDALEYSTYLDDNTFGHQATVADAACTTPTFDDTNELASIDSVRALSYDQGGTIKARAYYKDASGDLSVVGFDDADSPGSSISIATDITANNVSSHAHAMDGTKQWLVYQNGTTIYSRSTGVGDDTWGTEETELSSLTGPKIWSAEVYDNGGQKLAYLYLDGSAHRYNEKDIGVAGGILARPSHLRTPNLRL
jgi:hypothetical protein